MEKRFLADKDRLVLEFERRVQAQKERMEQKECETADKKQKHFSIPFFQKLRKKKNTKESADEERVRES